MLVGNKSDLKHLRAVPTDEAKAFSSKSWHAELCSPFLGLSWRINYSWKWIVIHWDISAGRLQCWICIPNYPYRSVMPVCCIIKFYIEMTCVDIYRIVSSKSLESSTSNIEPPKTSINVGPTVDSNANQGSKCCWFGYFLHCPLLDNSGGVWIVTADTCSPFSEGKFSGCIST